MNSDGGVTARYIRGIGLIAGDVGVERSYYSFNAHGKGEERMVIRPLPNGIKAVYYPVKTAHSISIGLYIRVGSRYETRNNNGISHLLEHMHFRRLGSMTQNELYHFTDVRGTTLRAATYKDYTSFYLKMRPQHLKDCVHLFKDIIEMYDWTEEDLNIEKMIVSKQICERRGYFNVDEILYTAGREENTFSFPIIGDTDVVQSISLQQLCAFKEKHYCADKMVLVVTGNFKEGDVDFLNDYLSEIQTHDNPLPERPLCVPTRQRKPDVLFCRNEEAYLDVTLYFDITPAPQRSLITLLNGVIGSGTTSWLQKELRERSGLSTDLCSSIDIYNDFAVLDISYGVDKKDLKRSLLEITRVLNLAKEGLNAKVLEENIHFFTENLWFELDDPQRLNFAIGWDMCTTSAGAHTIEEQISEYLRITPDDLMSCARQIFSPEHASIVIFGAAGKVTKKEIKEILSKLQHKVF